MVCVEDTISTHARPTRKEEIVEKGVEIVPSIVKIAVEIDLWRLS